MAEETKEAASSKATPKKGAKKKAAKNKARAKSGREVMTTKKKRAASSKGSKTDFINTHADLTPLQVEEKAKAAGLDIKAAYVSSVRSKAKAKGTNGTPARSPRGKASSRDAEAAFRQAARAITLDRAQEILDEIAAAYEG